MVTKLSKKTRGMLEVCLMTARHFEETSVDDSLASSYWNGYRVAAEQFLRILGGESQ